MPTFHSTPCPAESPWGKIQEADQQLPSIWSVMTASHGGFMLSDARQHAMPEALRLETSHYEEDCNWALVVLAFEDEFAARQTLKPSVIRLAKDTAKCWHPDRYTAFTGEAVTLNDSHIMRHRAAYAAAIGKFSIISAWGSWCEWVPEGKTGVSALKVESVDHLGNASYSGESIYALVAADAYSKRGDVAILDDFEHYIIDTPEMFRPKVPS